VGRQRRTGRGRALDAHWGLHRRALGLTRALLVVVQIGSGVGSLELESCWGRSRRNRGAVRMARCSDWGLEDLDMLDFKERPFVAPPALRLTPSAAPHPVLLPGAQGAPPAL